MSEVISRKATPEEIADLDRRARLKYDGPPVKKWEPTLTRQQYFEKRVAGDGRQAIILKHFNNESDKLAKQLREWGIKSWKEEMAEVEALAKGVKTTLTITKDEYLQRRLAGETRTRIMRSLGGSPTKFYKLLEEWGIRELDAEERALELLTPVKPASEVDRRTAELIEQKATARGLIEFNAQYQSAAPAEVNEETKPNDEKPAGQEILDRVEQRAEEKEQIIAQLQAELDKAVEQIGSLLDKRGEDLLRFEKAAIKIQEQEARICELEDDLLEAGANQAGYDSIRELEEEREMLLRTIESAAVEANDSGHVIIRMPVLPVTTANAERARIYDAVEALGSGVEAAEIDRERVMRELFAILQRAVSFVTADLAELLPGQDVSEHVQRFFEAHNVRHIASVAAMQEAG
ncbi:hypothetical protein J4772_11345 [Cohnella sp. LGH]|uniref:hypothetical protein n=1 Tax=Cohnella sp. LGH TaxID=1619153 RepID=UPI001ADCB6D5|nr:hypothetical protein [Cohnella sp. LGH]QTH44936.1 hypothetical protein J4772_11345 [Cohnella sp. LGH]